MAMAAAEQLEALGHEVSIFCSSASYQAASPSTMDFPPETTGSRIKVHRINTTSFGGASLLGRTCDAASYYIGVSWALVSCNPAPERIVAMTSPPFLSVIARLISKFRGGDHVHWVMDLYPDVMIAAGMLRRTSLSAKFLRAVARWGFGGKRCMAVIGLGPDMGKLLNAYLEAGRTSLWVPLWSGPAPATAEDFEASRQLRNNRGWKIDELVLMYSGNMGRGHTFETFLEFARQLEPNRKVKLVFFGNGKRRCEIEELVVELESSMVELHGPVHSTILNAHLLSADVHLASLDSAWEGCMVPSKIQGSFAIGRPIIFVGTRTSSIGQWIIKSGGGWVVNGHREFEAAVIEALDSTQRMERGTLAKQFAKAQFDQAENSSRVALLMACQTVDDLGRAAS